MRYVFLIAVALVLGVPHASRAATMTLAPSGGTYSVGDTITVRISVSSDTSINAVSGTLTFPRSLLAVDALSKTSSIINFWASEPAYSNSAGTISFEGVSLAGFQGNGGRIISITLRALREGTGRISFQSGQVLANDGQGTDVTRGLSGATFEITAATPAPAAPEPTPTPAATSTVEVRQPFTITLSAKNGVTVIFGASAHHNRRVEVSFKGIDGSTLLVMGTSDESGTFVIPLPRGLRDGNYIATATFIDRLGAPLEKSNPLSVTVGTAGPSDVWTWVFAAMLIVIILLVILIVLFWHDFVRNRRIQHKFTHEMREAQETLRKSFDVLRQDLKERLKDLKTKGASVAGEKATIMELKKDLDQAEGIIGKEIDDIESPGK